MADLVMYEAEFQQIQDVCARLHRDSNAKAVLLIDKNGQMIAEAGDTSSLDTTLALVSYGWECSGHGRYRKVTQGEGIQRPVPRRRKCERAY